MAAEQSVNNVGVRYTLWVCEAHSGLAIWRLRRKRRTGVMIGTIVPGDYSPYRVCHWLMKWHVIVGANIRRLRDARDWSLEELADLAGMDVGYLGKIERGKRNPSLKKLEAISDAMGVELSEFFDRRE